MRSVPTSRRLTRRTFCAGGAAAFFGPVTAAVAGGCRDREEARATASFWYSYGGQNRQTLERLVDRFNARSARSRVRDVFQGDYYEGLAKLRLAVAAKAAPSVTHVIAEAIPYLVEAEVLEPLSGYPGASAIKPIGALGQSGTWLGGAERELWCLPFNRSTPIAYLDADVFEAKGLSSPETWEELRDTARALTVVQGSRTTRYGFECPISWWFWTALVYQAGGRLIEPDGTISLGGEPGIRALALWQTMVHRDRSMKPPPGRDASANEMVNSDFLSGRAPMIWNSTAFVKYLEDNAVFRVVAAPLPSGMRPGVPTGGTFFVLMADAPEKAKLAGWEFVRFMLETEQVIDWSTSTGYLPTTDVAASELQRRGFYDRHPNYRVALEQLPMTEPWPWSRDLFEIEREVLEPLIERAVLESTNAATLLNGARRQAQSLAESRGRTRDQWRTRR